MFFYIKHMNPKSNSLQRTEIIILILKTIRIITIIETTTCAAGMKVTILS